MPAKTPRRTGRQPAGGAPLPMAPGFCDRYRWLGLGIRRGVAAACKEASPREAAVRRLTIPASDLRPRRAVDYAGAKAGFHRQVARLASRG